MKKLFLLLSLIISLTIANNVYAARDIKIFIDGNQKILQPSPIIKNDSTLVPMRPFFETMGAKVYWYGETRTVIATREEIKIKISIGKIDAYVNDKRTYLNVEPQIIGDKTYIPLRFISESLGAEVYWDDKSSTITIKDKTRTPKNLLELTDTQKYELQTTYSFVNEGDETDIDFSVLIGAVSNSPYQKDEDIGVTPEPYKITLDDYGNKYAGVKIDGVKPGQAFNITITKVLYNSGIHYSINEKNPLSDYTNLSNYTTYISPQRLIESDNQQIISKAQALSGGERDSYRVIKKVYEFVNQSLTYDTSEKYAGKGALSALMTGRGVCEEYSKLFVALLRANNIPARSVYGFWLQDDHYSKIGYDKWYDVNELRHEWPEFYLAEYGWVVVEPTYVFTQNSVKSTPWDQFANQEKHGHIIDGYESDSEYDFKGTVRGYGELKITHLDTKKEIRKVK